ncbi:hypothetical protein Sango_1887700 [Sesamum angolense]|uniref:Retrotransposon gag protein n=1 Tax=Sesamum angolense TaxID=2727404 RepID=A0AAE1WJ64_9LAMI|nr:hypothetical protein Sango_1887700 [Sesamum angolense]
MRINPPSSPRSVSSYSFTTNVAPVIVTNATTTEEQLASLTRAIEGLTKHVQEQDAQIAQLINKADNIDASHVMGKQVEAHDEVEAPAKQHYTKKDKYIKELQISSDGLIPVDQLKEFIEESIRSKIEGKLKLEQEFLNRFYSTRRTVSIVELTNSCQRKEEPVIDYIIRWRNLSLNCKDQLSEASAIEMCIQMLHWGLYYILQGILPKFFEELATRAHDIELSMTTSRVEGQSIQELRRTEEKQEANLIDLPEMKRPEEAERKDDPNIANTIT